MKDAGWCNRPIAPGYGWSSTVSWWVTQSGPGPARRWQLALFSFNNDQSSASNKGYLEIIDVDLKPRLIRSRKFKTLCPLAYAFI